jgi:hypothetical protein
MMISRTRRHDRIFAHTRALSVRRRAVRSALAAAPSMWSYDPIRLLLDGIVVGATLVARPPSSSTTPHAANAKLFAPPPHFHENICRVRFSVGGGGGERRGQFPHDDDA